MNRLFVAIALMTTFIATKSYAGPVPDLATLSKSGFILGPGNAANPIHSGWKNTVAVMKNVDVFDPIIERIEEVICSNEVNKSVLLIGENSLAYQYIFARIANHPGGKCPASMWHVDINVSKVEAGHRYVGEVDEYWQEKILEPSDGKDVVMYLQSVGSLIGIGSHANDDTGIEREYVANITSGRMRSLAYTDKYEFNDIVRSKHGYVMESFAEKIVLPPLTDAQTKAVVQAYLSTLYPNLSLATKELDYLLKTIAFYQPNRSEPERSISVINDLVRSTGKRSESKPISFQEVFESPHPYPINSTQSWSISHPNVSVMQLSFESFEMENGYDWVEVYNEATGGLLEKFTGPKGAFVTAFYPTNKIKVVLVSDGTTVQAGFKINAVNGKRFETYNITRADVRESVMSVAGIPRWLVDRDFSVVRELQGKLDADVVGVTEGKKDMVRLAKNGYVAGRTDDKPIATILLTGPTGTGKSYIAKKMAEFMKLNLVTIDMTTYKEPSTFKAFQETLANYLVVNPYAMFLFEEIDKASMEVLDQLYFMMDEGVFYDARQRPIFARGAFIMMTTNAGSDTILKNKDAPNLRELVFADLKKMFRMSFLNRFDAVSIFKPFTQAEFAQLAKTLMDKKVKNMKNSFSWYASVDQGIYDYVARFGQHEEFGARPMERLVETTLGTGIAEYQINVGPLLEESKLAFSKLAAVHEFKLAVDGGKVINYTVEPPPAITALINEPKAYTSYDPAIWKALALDRMFDDN